MFKIDVDAILNDLKKTLESYERLNQSRYNSIKQKDELCQKRLEVAQKTIVLYGKELDKNNIKRPTIN